MSGTVVLLEISSSEEDRTAQGADFTNICMHFRQMLNAACLVSKVNVADLTVKLFPRITTFDTETVCMYEMSDTILTLFKFPRTFHKRKWRSFNSHVF